MGGSNYAGDADGKRALDTAMLGIGRLVAETLMYMEREEKSGPDYHPTSSGLRKWASQRGSIYIGDQKLAVEHPRLRGPEGEVGLRTYEQLKSRGGFSDELLAQVLRGMSARKYEETVTNAGKAFGVTPMSRVEATATRLKQFQERRLEDFCSSRCTSTRSTDGGQAFVVALGVDRLLLTDLLFCRSQATFPIGSKSRCVLYQCTPSSSARGGTDAPQVEGPPLLRKSLHSTNPIESMFSMVRSCERNIKRYRSSKMRQRWLAAVLLDHKSAA